jgi:heat-inducible transcriptional repressor
MQSSLREHANVMSALIDAVGRIERDNDDARDIVVGGGSNILHYPEYSDAAKARGFLTMLEEREHLLSLFPAGQTGIFGISPHMNGLFTLRIGSETGVPELTDCAMVSASYTAAGEHPGAIGVIGPVRMRYGHVLSVLAFMTRYLSDALFMSSDL